MPEASNENELGVSISGMCNSIKGILSPVVSQLQGICVVADNVDDKVLRGFQNVIGPIVLVTFVGEEKYGSDDVAELTSRVTRHFDILVKRGKVLCSPLTTALTVTEGPSLPFYDLMETIRDSIRTIEWPAPMVLNPGIYNSTRPANEPGQLIDSYIISYSVITMIGQVMPPEIFGGSQP